VGLRQGPTETDGYASHRNLATASSVYAAPLGPNAKYGHDSIPQRRQHAAFPNACSHFDQNYQQNSYTTSHDSNAFAERRYARRIQCQTRQNLRLAEIRRENRRLRRIRHQIPPPILYQTNASTWRGLGSGHYIRQDVRRRAEKVHSRCRIRRRCRKYIGGVLEILPAVPIRVHNLCRLCQRGPANGGVATPPFTDEESE
jgi:hypothetical protein